MHNKYCGVEPKSKMPNPTQAYEPQNISASKEDTLVTEINAQFRKLYDTTQEGYVNKNTLDEAFKLLGVLSQSAYKLGQSDLNRFLNWRCSAIFEISENPKIFDSILGIPNFDPQFFDKKLGKFKRVLQPPNTLETGRGAIKMDSVTIEKQKFFWKISENPNWENPKCGNCGTSPLDRINQLQCRS
jgi:hypothetical protein